jgi:hypothetical protein
VRLTAIAALSAAMVVTANLAEPQKFGAGVSMTETTPIESVLAAPSTFAGKTLRVEGTVTAVCAHEGCWMALTPDGRADGPTIRLKVDDGVIVFPVTAKGRKAVAQGVFERVGGDPEGPEAASEHAKQSAKALSEASKNWQIKATGALVY